MGGEDSNIIWGRDKDNPMGELRRFDLLTNDKKEIAELAEVLRSKGLSRRELAIILFRLRVRPGFDPSDFGIK